mgnify:FL=1
MEVVFPHLEKWQSDVFNYYKDNPTGKIITVLSSRQIGKSTFAQILLIYRGLQSKCTSLCVSPVLSQSRKMFNDICSLAQPLVKYSNGSTYEITFLNGSKVLFRSAEQGNTIRGITTSGICIIDEAAYIQDDVMYSIIMPTTTVYNADIFIFSTPRNKQGFFYDFYAQGLNNDSKIKSFNWAAYDTSKYLPAETKELYRRQMPKQAFKCEILGEFADGDGQVFSNFKSCVQNNIIDIHQPIYIGVDPSANTGNDDTSITIGQLINNIILVEEIITFNDKTANDTIRYIVQLLNKYKGSEIYLKMEKQSIGNVYFSLLQDELDKNDIDATISTFNTTNKSKDKIIKQLLVLFERNMIEIPNDKKLLNELEAYEAKLSPSGCMTYNARPGCKDDMIMSTAIMADMIYNELEI